MDPTTGQPFAGNKIPASRIDPNGKALLNVFPQPNFTNRAVSSSLKRPRGRILISGEPAPLVIRLMILPQPCSS